MEFLKDDVDVVKSVEENGFCEPLVEKRKSVRNKIGYYQAKKWFLTFPRCDVDKSVVLERLLAMDKIAIQGVMISQEHHEDGGKHLHIGLWLKKSVRLTTTYFDTLVDKHGNYARMKSDFGTVRYLKKEDNNPLVHGEVPTLGSSSKSAGDKKGVTNDIVDMMQRGLSLQEIFNAYPGFYLMHRPKIEGMFHQLQTWQGTKQLRPWKELVYTGDCYATKQVVDWLNENIKKPRKHKQKQLYIYGPPGTHKSTLLTQLSRYLRTYDLPAEDFYDMYPMPEPELVVMDEFKGQKTIQFLNQFVEGVPMTLRVKGGQKMKKTNPPVIICSNLSLDDVYHKKAMAKSVELNALHTRFIEICLGTDELPIKLDVAALFADDEAASQPLSVTEDDIVFL